jgi:hypothetical protein
VELAEQTDFLWDRADALCDLADVLEACRQNDEADRARERALRLYEEKGVTPAAVRLRALLPAGVAI